MKNLLVLLTFLLAFTQVQSQDIIEVGTFNVNSDTTVTFSPTFNSGVTGYKVEAIYDNMATAEDSTLIEVYDAISVEGLDQGGDKVSTDANFYWRDAAHSEKERLTEEITEDFAWSRFKINTKAGASDSAKVTINIQRLR